MSTQKTEERISFINLNPKLSIIEDLNLKGLLFGKYKIMKKIGQGSYSSIFLGKDIHKNKYVAIKTQRKNCKQFNQLEKEAYYLYFLKGLGIPKVISFGYRGNYNILVETLLGKPISNFFSMKQDAQKKMKDLCMVAVQIIDRIQYIHSKNILHLDIKPDNFLVGNPNDSLIYMVDFGLSIKYRSSRTGKHINFSKNKIFQGTFNYSSVNLMGGIQPSRRDDLISIGYMLIYLIKGKLPWSKYEKDDLGKRFTKIYNMKKNMTNQDLCKYLPREFCLYMDYVQSLKFSEEPNYFHLRKLFISILDKMNDKYDLKFSWIKNKKKSQSLSNNFSLTTTLNNTFRKKSFYGSLFASLKENKIKNSMSVNKNDLKH